MRKQAIRITGLWARMHLDTLLEQVRPETIKDEIIALSKSTKIITPYTSFLVLETDADRSGQGKRRFRCATASVLRRWPRQCRGSIWRRSR